MKKIISAAIITMLFVVSASAQSRGNHRGQAPQPPAPPQAKQAPQVHAPQSHSRGSHNSNSHHSSHGNHHDSHHSSHGNHNSHHNYWSSSRFSISTGASNGHYEYVTQKVWVADRCERVWIAPQYEFRRLPCGTFTRVIICDGYYTERAIPGYYDYQTVKVWKPACNTGSSLTFRWGR
jgi:hypothetical protein